MHMVEALRERRLLISLRAVAIVAVGSLALNLVQGFTIGLALSAKASAAVSRERAG